MNAHHTMWDKRGTPNKLGEILHSWMLRWGYSTWNKSSEATILNPSGNPTSPDMVMSGAEFDKSSWRTLPAMGSDHVPMFFSLRGGVSQPTRRVLYSWGKEARSAYRETMEEKCSRLLRARDPIRLNAEFRTLLSATESCVPRKGQKKGKVWWNDEIDALARRRSTLKAKLLSEDHDGNDEDLARLAAMEAELDRAITSGKQAAWGDYTKKLSKDGNLTQAFSVIRRFDGRSEKPPIAPLRRGNGIATTDREKASVLVEHYARACSPRTTAKSEEVITTIKKDAKPGTDNDFPLVTKDELDSVLRRLKKGKAPGPDGIYNEMLKYLGPVAREVQLLLYNSSLQTGVVPAEWRRSSIIPLMKKGKDQSEPASYRPIALTSNIVKTLERIVKDRMCFLQDTGRVRQLHTSQAGFRKGRSTEENVLYAASKLKSVRLSQGLGGLLLFDFKGAFDTVWHKGVIAKLIGDGYPPKLVKWITSFLDQRKASVCVNGEHGCVKTMTGGVPQGTILAPQLFSIYVNDLARLYRKAGIDAVVYADDIAIVLEAGSPAELNKKVQRAVSLTERWCETFSMKLSQEKTEFMPVEGQFWNSHDSLANLINARFPSSGAKVKVVREAKYLGVTFDESMNFHEHVQKVKGKINSRLRLLRKLAGTSGDAASTP
eukprot:TRINITY_DN5720_c2_g2_i3.p1 TRINITY_DN5720_c2_g2~~TRINITY_DN5720_c2_g2_i3.p1  ORF type:complete len:659 (+),score=146.06 TRINITY_DN5720_c2_g2_i3:2197-4173(+)